MHITGQELAAASSGVAALAIVGGYLGVRSANRNALKLAREERSAKQNNELVALKRMIYLKLLNALDALAVTNMEQKEMEAKKVSANFRVVTAKRRIEASKVAHSCIVEVTLITDNQMIRDQAREAYQGAITCTGPESEEFTRGVVKLRTSLSNDLYGKEFSSPKELDRMIDKALAKQRPSTKPAEGTAETADEG